MQVPGKKISTAELIVIFLCQAQMVSDYCVNKGIVFTVPKHLEERATRTSLNCLLKADARLCDVFKKHFLLGLCLELYLNIRIVML